MSISIKLFNFEYSLHKILTFPSQLLNVVNINTRLPVCTHMSDHLTIIMYDIKFYLISNN